MLSIYHQERTSTISPKQEGRLSLGKPAEHPIEVTSLPNIGPSPDFPFLRYSFGVYCPTSAQTKQIDAIFQKYTASFELIEKNASQRLWNLRTKEESLMDTLIDIMEQQYTVRRIPTFDF